MQTLLVYFNPLEPINTHALEADGFGKPTPPHCPVHKRLQATTIVRHYGRKEHASRARGRAHGFPAVKTLQGWKLSQRYTMKHKYVTASGYFYGTWSSYQVIRILKKDQIQEVSDFKLFANC